MNQTYKYLVKIEEQIKKEGINSVLSDPLVKRILKIYKIRNYKDLITFIELQKDESINFSIWKTKTI